MRWIKYQIVQCIVEEEPVLVEKKVGYSEENIAIAEDEAYNGEYEVVDDEFEPDDSAPTLEELSYLKGANSNIQEQLNNALIKKDGKFVINGMIILNSDVYGDELPAPGIKGRLFLKKV